MSYNADISVLSICNSALIKVGEKMISALSEQDKRARIVSEQYKKVKGVLLRAHPWNFAMKRMSFGLDVAVPHSEFKFQFIMPSDCLRVWRVIGSGRYKVERNAVLADSNNLSVLYISNVEENYFDETFAECLATKLAHDISFAIVQSVSLKQGLYVDYLELLRDARSFDAQEGTPDKILDGGGDFLTARF